jgi:hypothetical protein
MTNESTSSEPTSKVLARTFSNMNAHYWAEVEATDSPDRLKVRLYISDYPSYWGGSVEKAADPKEIIAQRIASVKKDLAEQYGLIETQIEQTAIEKGKYGYLSGRKIILSFGVPSSDPQEIANIAYGRIGNSFNKAEFPDKTRGITNGIREVEQNDGTAIKKLVDEASAHKVKNAVLNFAQGVSAVNDEKFEPPVSLQKFLATADVSEKMEARMRQYSKELFQLAEKWKPVVHKPEGSSRTR